MTNGKDSYDLIFKPGMKLIHFYRHTVVNAKTDAERKFKNYCFGYEKDGTKAINVIIASGRVFLTEDGHVPVNWFDHEHNAQ